MVKLKIIRLAIVMLALYSTVAISQIHKTQTIRIQEYSLDAVYMQTETYYIDPITSEKVLDGSFKKLGNYINETGKYEKGLKSGIWSTTDYKRDFNTHKFIVESKIVGLYSKGIKEGIWTFFENNVTKNVKFYKGLIVGQLSTKHINLLLNDKGLPCGKVGYIGGYLIYFDDKGEIYKIISRDYNDNLIYKKEYVTSINSEFKEAIDHCLKEYDTELKRLNLKYDFPENLFVMLGTNENNLKEKESKIKEDQLKQNELGVTYDPKEEQLKQKELSKDIENSEDNSIKSLKDTDVKPDFPGGIGEFYSFLAKNYQAPEEEGLKGKVYVTFVVEKDGSLTDIKVLRDIGYGTGKEAIRVLNISPKWNPGEQNGKKVRCTFSIPINIESAK